MVKVVVDYNDDPVYFEDKADRKNDTNIGIIILSHLIEPK